MWNRADLQTDDIRCLQYEEIESCKVQKKGSHYSTAPPSLLGQYDVQVHEKCNKKSKTSCWDGRFYFLFKDNTAEGVDRCQLKVLAKGDHH